MKLTSFSTARSESHVEEEEDHWRERIEKRLFQNYIVGSMSKLKLLSKLFQDRESSSLVCDDDHEQDQEHSLPVIQEVQSRSGELKKTAEDHDDFLGKVRTGGSVVNDEILGFAKLFNDELTLDNISRIKNDDKMIQSKGGVDALSEDELRETCRERGMLGLRSVEEMRQQVFNITYAILFGNI
ncbi:hypothetical protein CTI12_AA369040 [Artemisia annua]|uniref:Letm1 RBD domain-containing protein n=1 Tax=Artemisia annua TaxID=35608 RepID=A0A2U1MJS4_ARTAN|nr:hypothetical protein CTI12_AA369040 [Artemisia annua]